MAQLLVQLLPRFHAERRILAPVTIVRLGRVALVDEAAEGLSVRLVVVVTIGERPGLSSPDSMGMNAA